MPTPVSEAAPAPLTITLFGPMQVFVAGAAAAPPALPQGPVAAGPAGPAPRPARRARVAGRHPLARRRPGPGLRQPAPGPERTAAGAGGRRAAPSVARPAHALRWTSPGPTWTCWPSTRRSREGALPSLARAVALYTGPLLEGCAEEWAPQERGAREQDCLRALQTLADAALAAGDYGDGGGYYRRAVSPGPVAGGARSGG